MKSRLVLLVVCLVTIGASLFYVRGRFLLVELSFAVAEKKELKTKLEQEKRALTLELATLQTPARIEKIARRTLNLTRSEASVPVVVVGEARLR